MSHPGRSLVGGTILLLSLIWGTTWAAIRIGLEGVPPFTGVALRFGIASVVLLILGRLQGVRYGASRRERVLWIVNGLLSFCGSYGIVYWCEQRVPSGLASVLFATFPLFVAILAHFLLPAESLRPRMIVGILLAFGGVAAIFSEDFAKLGGPGVAAASVVMLSAPLVSAVASVAIKKWGGGVHHLSITAIPMGMAAVVMGIVAAFTERGRPVVWNRASVAALLYLAIAGSAVTFSLYYWLLSHIPATRLSLVAYTAPVVAVTVGSVFLHEPYTLRTILGSALVIGGVVLSANPFRREPARAAAAAVLVATLLGASYARAAEPGPLRFPEDPAPPAVRALGSLEGVLAFTSSADMDRAAAAFDATREKEKKRRSVVRVVGASGHMRELPIDGTVRALRFGPPEEELYAIVSNDPTKFSAGETSLIRIDTSSLKTKRATNLPTTARDMDLTADDEGLIVASRNDLRVLLIPELRSSRLFRLPGDNLSIAVLPGGSSVLVGRNDGVLLVDLSDPQGRDGLPVRGHVNSPAPVERLVASPDGREALARLDDGRTFRVSVDPPEMREVGFSTAIAWPGRRVPQAPPAAVELPPKPPMPEPTTDDSAALTAEPQPPRAEESPARGVDPPSREVPVHNPPSVPVDPAPRGIRGRIAGPSASGVAAIILLGPDNLLHEAARVAPGADGSWSTGPLPKGTYRIVVDAGGNRVAVCDPPFGVVSVGADGATDAPEIRVVRITAP